MYKFFQKHFFLFLLFIYVVIFIGSSVKPLEPSVGLVEAITSAIAPAILLILYFCKIRFSNLAYFLAFFLPVLHVIGAHYTFANVPFEWFNNLIGSDRNMYDRLAHATVGFYAFLIIELFLKFKLANKKGVVYTYALFFIMALAGIYELFEGGYAISVDPKAGIEILGSQGDIWDAQKDILMDTLGAIFGCLMFKIFNFKKFK